MNGSCRTLCLVLILTLTGYVFGYANLERGKRMEAGSNFVSMINLIAHPERYESKPIRVYGVFSLNGLESNLYISQEAYDFKIHTDKLDLRYRDDMEMLDDDFLKAAEGKMAYIEGIFGSAPAGWIQVYRIVILNKGEK